MSPLGATAGWHWTDALSPEPCEDPLEDPPDCRACGDTGWRDLEGGESALCECAVRKQSEWRAVVADHRNDAARDDALTEADVPF